MSGVALKKKSSRARKTASQRGTGSHRAYEALWQRIVTLEMDPGADIDETTLVRELGLSRTPVREALIRLASEGLITLAPNRGASVTPLEFSRVHENLEALDLFQRTATRLAAERRSETDLAEMERHCEAFETASERRDPGAMIETNWDFHAAIAAAAGNGYIEKTYRQVLVDGLRIARLAMAYECYGSESDYRRHIEAILREHRQMVDFIGRGAADRAEAVAASHAGLARTRVTDYFRLTGTAGIAVAKGPSGGPARRPGKGD